MEVTPAPRPLATFEAAAAVHRQRAPQASRCTLECRATFDLRDESVSVLGIPLPVRQTRLVVRVGRVLPVDVFGATGAVRVAHGPRYT
jgi:hypothetical protein